jgi:hypothetical protein
MIRRMPPQPVVPTAIVGQAVDLFRRHFAVLYPVALIFGLVNAMITHAVEDTNAVAIGFGLTIVIGTLFQGLVVGFVRDVEAGLPQGAEPSIGALVRSVAPVIGPLVGASILSALGVGLGLVLLIVPGLFLMTIWSVVAPVVVLERAPVFAAFGRSRALVQGFGWPVFGTLVLLFLLLLPAAVVALVATEALGDLAGSLVEVLVTALATTVSVLGTATLYFRLRDAESAAPPAADPDRDAAAV